MTHLSTSHQYWKQFLKPTDLAIDATCGNGCDTLALAQLLPSGLVFGIDIQEIALTKTLSKLKNALAPEQLTRIHLHHQCHSLIDTLPLPYPPRLIVYNLGYLPGGNKDLTTERTSTLQSLQKSSALLAPDGALSIMCYPGHPEGAKEKEVVLEWASSLKGWLVEHRCWRLSTTAPSWLWICKPT